MNRVLTLLLCTFAASHAFAESRATKSMEAAQFDSLAAQQMDTETLYYNQKVLTFVEWGQQFPVERNSLVIYPGYVEPTVTTVKNGITKKTEEKLVVFVVRAKLLLKKPASQINLRALTDLNTISKFDGEIQHQPIQPGEFMANVVGRGPVKNFTWCNKTGPNITRPNREVELSHTNPKSRAWCSESGRSICVESCYLFSKFWTEGVRLANLALAEAERKDYGIAMQSEIRFFSNEKELGLPMPAKNLTRLETPVRGGLEQNIFYFNQVMEFGKVVAVLQDMPGNPAQSVASAYIVIAVKKRTYNQFSEVKNILLGQSILFNTKTGITAGLPVFTQNMIKSIADVFEN